jgi:hypothetical protein
MAEVDLAARKALFQKSKGQSSNENNMSHNEYWVFFNDSFKLLASQELPNRHTLLKRTGKKKEREVRRVDEPDDSENSPLSRENMFFFSDLVDWI